MHWNDVSMQLIDPRQKEVNVKGELEKAGEKWRLRFTRNLRHQPQEVWEAITQPEHLKAWFPQEIVGKWEKGASLEFKSSNAEANFKGEVLAVDPPKLLEFRWGTDTIRIEIAPSGSGSTLTLLDTFDEMGKAARDAAGWHVCLDALERHIDGKQSVGSPGANWDEVHDDYVRRLGPEASTIGPPERRSETA